MLAFNAGFFASGPEAQRFLDWMALQRKERRREMARAQVCCVCSAALPAPPAHCRTALLPHACPGLVSSTLKH
jgi:hypothetical protein